MERGNDISVKSDRALGRPEEGRGGRPPLFPELAIYLVLLALGAASLWIAHLPVFGGYNLSVSLSIAAIMVVIVLATFMELRRETTLILLTAVSAVMWLAILFTLTLADYATRPQGTGETLSKRVPLFESDGSGSSMASAAEAAKAGILE